METTSVFHHGARVIVLSRIDESDVRSRHALEDVAG